jgi:hypothetical protein
LRVECAAVSLRAVILGNILLVRQPIAQSLGALDFVAFESSEFSHALSALDHASPSLVVMDVDGMTREWRMLAARLFAKRGTTALVLVASRFSFDDAHDAMSLSVAGVIMKPFRNSQHTGRLLDLALRHMHVKARRSTARFTVPEGVRPALRLAGSKGEFVLPLKNISERGAAIDMNENGGGSILHPGGFFPLATLSWGEVQLETAIEVVHCDTQLAGIRFSRIFDGAPRFLRALEERQERAIGPQEMKRKW